MVKLALKKHTLIIRQYLWISREPHKMSWRATLSPQALSLTCGLEEGGSPTHSCPAQGKQRQNKIEIKTTRPRPNTAIRIILDKYTVLYELSDETSISNKNTHFCFCARYDTTQELSVKLPRRAWQFIRTTLIQNKPSTNWGLRLGHN